MGMGLVTPEPEGEEALEEEDETFDEVPETCSLKETHGSMPFPCDPCPRCGKETHVKGSPDERGDYFCERCGVSFDP